MIYFAAAIVALVILVVIGVVNKRRIERQEAMLGLRHELIEIINEAQSLLGRIEEDDLDSHDELVRIEDHLTAKLARLEQIERIYGIALAKRDTESDPEMLDHLMCARATITVALERVRIIMGRLDNGSKQ